MNDCPMYRAGANTDICQKCGQNRFAHRMTAKRYFNDPEARAFFEELDRIPWWEGICYVLLFVCFMLPIMLVARLFGWRPGDE